MALILVIDDDEQIRTMLRITLEKSGYDVQVAKDGNEGLDVFRQYQPDLVISDIVMPEKEGIETIKELRLLSPDLKIIAISGGGVVSPEVYIELARGMGADHGLTKPIEYSDLIGAVRDLLEETE